MFDREAVLAAVDLPMLADELLGQRAGHPRTPTWGCPNPDHYQTGRTPPVTVFTTRWGEQRWHCHGCGTGGSAVDLVMQVDGVDARQALECLAERTGVVVEVDGHHRRRRTNHQSKNPAQRGGQEHLAVRSIPALERYVSECAEALGQPDGAPFLRWLTKGRRLPENVLRLNRIGADRGPRHQGRPDGVPGVRRAVVLPVLADDGHAAYVQLRTLGAGRDFPRYLSCRDSLARNPRVGFYKPSRRFDYPFEDTDLIITEGIVDALSAAAAGYTAAAYLGADLPDRATAVLLARQPKRLIVAFDPDPAGRAGAYRLTQLLRERRRDAAIMDLKSGDLNSCLVRSTDWPVEMAGRIQHAAARLSRPTAHVLGVGD